MPIDTAAKRVSALRKTLPLPDGTIAQGDRQHGTWNYSGILAIELILYIVVHGSVSIAPWLTLAAYGSLPWVGGATSTADAWLAVDTAGIEGLTP